MAVTIPADRELGICTAYLRGYTVSEIARHLGVRHDAIHNVLRRHCVAMRGPGARRVADVPKDIPDCHRAPAPKS